MQELRIQEEVVNNDFRVGPWTVRPSLNIVTQSGTVSRLEPKIMQVLVYLASHPDSAVTKEEILKAVWPETFVSDDVLVRSVSELRRVFDDNAREPRFIETIPKRGYRLIARVAAIESNVAAKIPEATGLVEPHLPRRVAKFRWIALASLLLVCGSLVGFNVGNVKRHFLSTNGPSIRSLAVLPLQNLSGDPGQEYFSDGMTEELITELSRIKGVRVISRTSVMRYKNSDKSLPDIARQLGVDAIVEGSVLRSGNRVRITAQLIYARTDANLWAETYDRDARDLLGLQEAVASAIAREVKTTMIPSAVTQIKPRRSLNVNAHEAYLLGFHEDDIWGELSNRQGMQAIADAHHRRALEYYNEAIQEDPQFALAYLRLAADGSMEQNEAAAKKALEIDDSLSEADVILGAIELVRNRNWQQAERDFRRAIELNPSSATAHHGYAYFLDAAGRLEEGMKEWEQAQELDPGYDHLSGALYSRRQFDRLIELENAKLANSKVSPYAAIVAHKTLMIAYARLGRRRESIEAFSQALADYGYKALAEDLRQGYARRGYEGALRQWLKGVQKQKPKFPFDFVVAYVHTELGERDAATAELQTMSPSWDVVGWQVGNCFPNLVTLRIEPMWDPLRSDPKFQDLVASMHFPN
jgi:TolB-like protein/DNA-binding winged helix-turn-helix (wHTH) protein